ncbi:helix-turn-helix transcriptional regulator [Arsenophonus nasoniae]|uniref:Helix-turn-helix transcriptional regulator n=1 Tax=Arsenophonus nasoniae TaxID=638 RepID=A0AA95GRT4_9GAMM|nr:helix-turn-helix transcriptional regulator [Arsenophonus nasoniae]WGM04113.1 helix-turn-helix transcriptional regulator [Arsenophonus nasoniae]
MTAFDPTQYPELRNLFPELTPAQFETAMLFSLGLTKKEIAWAREVSYPAVRDTLQDIKNKFQFYSLSNLIATFHIRLSLFALYRCTFKNRE